LSSPALRIPLFIAISSATGAGCSLPRDVHGTAIDTLGSAENPDYQRQLVWWQPIQALAPNGTEYQVISAHVDRDGKFFIPAVWHALLSGAHRGDRTWQRCPDRSPQRPCS